jgi:uncharacterized membrane protein YfcA
MNSILNILLEIRVWLKILMAILLVVLGSFLFGPNFFLTLAAFIAASVANATAIGGGFLFMPLFIFVYQLAPPIALKLSIATQAFGMTSGALSWGRSYIDKTAFLIASTASIIGVWLATYGLAVPSAYIKPLFAIISLGVFFALVLEISLKVTDQQQKVNFRLNTTSIFYAFVALAGGLVTGWTAIGVGEVVALYLLFFYRLRLDKAIGTGVAVLAVSSIAGFIFHSDLGGIPLELLAYTVPGVILGGRYGVKVAKYIESNIKQSGSKKLFQKSPLKLIFAAVILIDCIVILLSEFFS